jgi:23S rRNA (cytosine1962-C5)-methyltransferase
MDLKDSTGSSPGVGCDGPMRQESMTTSHLPPCVLFEDDHLLVVHKPAGWNTHAPSPYAGEGIYDWLRHREPRWISLAIIHRLDKETSGVLLFSKTIEANRSLTDQFTRHRVRKKYVLLTDRPVKSGPLHATSCLVRVKDHYESRRDVHHGQKAETRFRVLQTNNGLTQVEAEPLTGRTHQIRVHAADLGFPILGDVLYGGTPAQRLMLHAVELTIHHPHTGEPMTFHAPVGFDQPPALALRAAFISQDETTAFRLIHSAADGWPGLLVDRLGEVLVAQSEHELSKAQWDWVTSLLSSDALLSGLKTVLHKRLRKDVRQTDVDTASPKLIAGAPAPSEWQVTENSVRYILRGNEGYSVGLFLDQRDNRRRLLTRHVAAGFALSTENGGKPDVLNTFAYTCGFSVCAALAGARTTNLDLSSKYLNWGQQNFRLNGLDPDEHAFIYGDCFDWLRRLNRKSRQFDLVILDPPTFSTSKISGVFRVEKDYGKLVSAVLPLLKRNGILLACANTARLAPEDFLNVIQTTIGACGPKLLQRHYAPQPPDFPVHRAEPAHLKTVWLRVA